MNEELCITKELAYRAKYLSFMRCPCKEHDYRFFECRYVKFEFWKETDYFYEPLFWKSLKMKDYITLMFTTKSESLACDSVLSIESKHRYTITKNGKPLHPSFIWDMDFEKDYKEIFDWYYKMNINVLFIDVNTDMDAIDPKFREFLDTNEFPFPF